MFHQLRIHTDLSKTGDRVDLVKRDRSVIGYKEVNARESSAVEQNEDPCGEIAYFTRRSLRESGRYVVACRVLLVFGLVIVEYAAGVNLAALRYEKRAVLAAQYRNLDLTPEYAALRKQLFVLGKCGGKRQTKRCAVVRPRYSDRRSGARHSPPCQGTCRDPF